MSVESRDLEPGPLVWIDCEMTGLNPRKDKLLEIAVRTCSLPFSRFSVSNGVHSSPRQVLITTGNLQVVDSGIQYVIKTEKEVLNG
jgi:oligoribonuclease